MTKTGRISLAIVAGAALLGPMGLRAETAADDDLSVVKKALQKSPAPAPEASGAKPQWIHVRIDGKAGKKEKVSINMPFALVEALGDDAIVSHHMKGDKEPIHLAEVLKSLKAGQEIVEIEDDEATIKVWVD
jgi:hypothetical protein